MQSTYVLQGLHLHIPNIFPEYPSNSSVALRAEGSSYKVRDRVGVQSPTSGPAGCLLLREEKETKQLPHPGGRGSSGNGKSAWGMGKAVPQPRHPAKMLNCSEEFRPALLPPVSARPSDRRAGDPQFYLESPHSRGPPDAQMSAFYRDFPNQFFGIPKTHQRS